MSNEISIEEKVNKYLADGSDYSFELRCLNSVSSMTRCAVDVSHSGTYKDEQTGKLRQFDIRAELWPIVPLNHIIHSSIECKNISKEAPLILHRSTRTRESAFIQYIETEYRDPDVDHSLKGAAYSVKTDYSFYPKSETTAKAIERVIWNSHDVARSSDSEIYDKWSQALSSTYDAVQAALNAQPWHLQQHKVSSKHYFIPIVAVPDTSLWVVEYDDSGAIQGDAKIVEDASYFVGRDYNIGESEAFTVSHVHFVCESRLSEFLWEMLNVLA